MYSPIFTQRLTGVPINTDTVLFLHTFFFLGNLPDKFQLPQPPQTLIYACFLISARLPCSVCNPLPLLIESRNSGKSEGSQNLFSFSQESKFYIPVAQYLKKIASYILSSFLVIYCRKSNQLSVMLSWPQQMSDLSFIKITFTEPWLSIRYHVKRFFSIVLFNLYINLRK